MIFLVVFWILCVSGILFLGFLWVRNDSVYVFRCKVLDHIHSAHDITFDPFDPDMETKMDQNMAAWQQHIDTFASVPYSEMVYKFWRPLRSFYPEDFLKEIGA